MPRTIIRSGPRMSPSQERVPLERPTPGDDLDGSRQRGPTRCAKTRGEAPRIGARARAAARREGGWNRIPDCDPHQRDDKWH